MPKIAPGTPAIRDPTSTDPRTTIGWIPTAPCMIRGWSTFMTTIQPMPMSTIDGTSASGLNTSAATTGGAHARNGPKNGMAISRPAVVDVKAARSSPSSRLVSSATAKYTKPISACPRRNPPNERATDVWSRRASSA